MNKYLKSIVRATGLSALNQKYKKWKKDKAVEAAKQHPFTKEILVEQLRDLGLREGDTAMVHSSLSAMGYVEGGAATLLEALLEALGHKGTLLLPAYPVADFSIENLRKLPTLEPTSKSYMGKVTNLILEREGVVRSLHPTHSWAGIGPQAEFLLHKHHHSVKPCGTDSPFERMLELNGWIVTLGSDWGKCTYWHIIEDRVDFPIEVYYPEEFSAPVRFPDNSVKEVPFKTHNPDNTPSRIDFRKDHERRILERFKAYRLVNIGQIGSGEAVAVRAKDFLLGLQKLLDEGITIYEGKP